MSWMKQRARVEARLRVVMWAHEHGATAAAPRFECSRTTVYQLQARYERARLQGLLNKPRGPAPALAEEVVEAIVELKTAQVHRSSTMIRHKCPVLELQDCSVLKVTTQWIASRGAIC